MPEGGIKEVSRIEAAAFTGASRVKMEAVWKQNDYTNIGCELQIIISL